MIESIGNSKPLSAAQRAAALKRASSTDAAAFAEALANAEASHSVESVEIPLPAASLTGVNLLSLQEVSDEDLHRQKNLKKGRLTLEALSQLRDAMLMGRLPLATLENLEKILVAERATNHDPRLEAILSEIETRAAVELAKLEMSGIVSQKSQD